MTPISAGFDGARASSSASGTFAARATEASVSAFQPCFDRSRNAASARRVCEDAVFAMALLDLAENGHHNDPKSTKKGSKAKDLPLRQETEILIAREARRKRRLWSLRIDCARRARISFVFFVSLW